VYASHPLVVLPKEFFPVKIRVFRLACFLASVGMTFGGSSAFASSCTTQGAMNPADKSSLLAVANPLAEAVAAGNSDTIHAALLPAIADEWDSIRNVVASAPPLFKGGTLRWRTMYLLDASDQKTPQDTEFFCTNPENTLTVTVNLHNLPPGRYALVLGDFLKAPLAGQLALILADSQGWKVGGLFVREGALDGRDGVDYWKQARTDAATTDNWSAWFSYETARWLLLPIDFLSSPNLQKLDSEQQQISPPSQSLPLALTASATAKSPSWKLMSARLDTSLHSADIALTYEGSGTTDPVAARAEAVNVMSALLRIHPGLRKNFHGLWAYAEKNGTQTFAIELPMAQIPQ
jgi:hypothetical protein